MTVRVTPLPGWRGGDGNAAYLDKMLRHGPVEEYFDESVNVRTIKRILVQSFTCAFLVFVFIAVISLAAGSEGSVDIGFLLGFVVFVLVFVLSKLDQPIGEWRVVIEERAAASDSVYSAIRGKLAERRLPIQGIRARRTREPNGSVNNRLVLVDGHYQVYVSVFAYGSSLYLGWMMYRTRRGSALISRYLGDLVATIVRRVDDVELMLRTERPRAMREVVHALCREGLNVAVERIEVPTEYGFPQGLPQIELLPAASAPGPRPPSAPLVPAYAGTAQAGGHADPDTGWHPDPAAVPRVAPWHRDAVVEPGVGQPAVWQGGPGAVPVGPGAVEGVEPAGGRHAEAGDAGGGWRAGWSARLGGPEPHLGTGRHAGGMDPGVVR